MAEVMRKRSAHEDEPVHDEGDSSLWTVALFAIILQLLIAGATGFLAYTGFDAHAKVRPAVDNVLSVDPSLTGEAMAAAVLPDVMVIAEQAQRLQMIDQYANPYVMLGVLIGAQVLLAIWAGVYASRAKALGVGMPVALVVIVGLIPVINLILFVPLLLVVKSGLRRMGAKTSALQTFVPLLGMLATFALVAGVIYLGFRGHTEVQALEAQAMTVVGGAVVDVAPDQFAALLNPFAGDAPPPEAGAETVETPSLDVPPAQLQALRTGPLAELIQSALGAIERLIELSTLVAAIRVAEALLFALAVFLLTGAVRAGQRSDLDAYGVSRRPGH